MKKFSVPIAISVTGIGIGVFRIIMPFYTEAIRPWSNYILFLSLLLIFSPWAVMLVLFFKKKKRERSDSPQAAHINDPNIFNLNEGSLKRWASNLANHYEHLDMVILYGAPVSFPSPIKYLIHYKFSANGSMGAGQIQEFDHMLAADEVFQDQIDLSDAYKENVPTDYKNEWFGIIDDPYGVDKKYYWVLYDRNST